MMIVGNASKLHGIEFADPAQMANALHVFTGGVFGSASCC